MTSTTPYGSPLSLSALRTAKRDPDSAASMVMDQRGWAFFAVTGEQLLRVSAEEGQLLVRDTASGAVRASLAVRNATDGSWGYLTELVPTNPDAANASNPEIRAWRLSLVQDRQGSQGLSGTRSVVLKAGALLKLLRAQVEVVSL